MKYFQAEGLDVDIVDFAGGARALQAVVGGPMPAGCLYAPEPFLQKNPNVAQALTNAIVRANKWIQQAGPGDILKVVPESYLLGDRAIYIDAFLKAKGALSPDGLFPEAGSVTALRALASVDESMQKAKLDLKANFTNEFARRANARYPKG
jgi:NitT/TauT family transport system substrate-binding protein